MSTFLLVLSGILITCYILIIIAGLLGGVEGDKPTVLSPEEWGARQEDYSNRRFTVHLCDYDEAYGESRWHNVDCAKKFAEGCLQTQNYFRASIRDNFTRKNLYRIRPLDSWQFGRVPLVASDDTIEIEYKLK